MLFPDGFGLPISNQATLTEEAFIEWTYAHCAAILVQRLTSESLLDVACSVLLYILKGLHGSLRPELPAPAIIHRSDRAFSI
jgi:hypothetical protein